MNLVISHRYCWKLLLRLGRPGKCVMKCWNDIQNFSGAPLSRCYTDPMIQKLRQEENNNSGAPWTAPDRKRKSVPQSSSFSYSFFSYPFFLPRAIQDINRTINIIESFVTALHSFSRSFFLSFFLFLYSPVCQHTHTHTKRRENFVNSTWFRIP